MVFVPTLLLPLFRQKSPKTTEATPESYRQRSPTASGVANAQDKNTRQRLPSQRTKGWLLFIYYQRSMAVMLFAPHRPPIPLLRPQVATLRLSLAPFRSYRFSVALASLGGLLRRPHATDTLSTLSNFAAGRLCFASFEARKRAGYTLASIFGCANTLI